MQRLILACTIIGALAAPRVARADGDFDSTGWTKLGEQSVDGRHDTDTIDVGMADGRFTKLTLVVLDDDLRLDAMTVTFGNGETFTPDVKQYFTDGSRTRAIDLPGDKRGIKTITLSYGNTGHEKWHGKHHDKTPARVQVWGMPAAAESAPSAWDSTGWTKLGETSADGRHDSDTIDVGMADGRFTKLTLVVLDDDLRLDAMTVTFGNGETFTPDVKQYFTEGSRTRAIDLPGDKRGIKTIALTYGTSGKEKWHGKKHDSTPARVQVWGMAAADTTTTTAPSWDSSGWTMIAAKPLSGRSGTISFNVKHSAAFAHLTLVADGHIHITGVQVTYGKGPRGKWSVEQDLDETAPNHQVDITDAKNRPIRSVTVTYRGRTGGKKRTTVTLWAQ